MRRILFILIIFLSTSAFAEKMVIRIPNPDPADFRVYQAQGLDIALYHPGRYLDIVIHEDLLEDFESQHPRLIITQSEARLKANLRSFERDLPGYRSYAELMAELQMLPVFYPHLVKLHSIGAGWGQDYAAQGIAAYQDFDHEIMAIKLSDNVSQTEDEAQFYFVGTHHAREPISLEVTMEILYLLLDNYGTDPGITDIVDSSEIWFIPLLNPDGHKLVIDETDVWWRKNIRDNNDNQAIDTGSYGDGADGVDLNRNYSYMRGNISASDDPWSVTYHGPAAFSEPETQALRDFLEARHFLAGISYHSYGEYVLYPYGFAHNTSGPDHQEQAALAQAMAATIDKQYGGTYDAMPSCSFYPVSGSCEDWTYGTLGIFSYTVEMATEFIPPAAQMNQIVQNHLNAALLLLLRKDYKTLTGIVTDSSTAEPLAAEIFVHGIDEHLPSRAAIYSRADFGRYFRFLPEGQHQVTISCPGYLPQTHSVEIDRLQQTLLDIALEPATLVEQVIQITDMVGNPLDRARLSSEELGEHYSSADGVIQLSAIYRGEYDTVISYPGFGSLHFSMRAGEGDLHFRLSDARIFADDFEDGITQWQCTGSWGLTSQEQYSGSFSLTDSPDGNYHNNIISSASTAQGIHLSSAERVNLQFAAKADFPPDSDYASLRYRLSGQSNWQTIQIFTGSMDWTHYDLDLSFLAGESIYLSFAIHTSSSTVADGVYIDDLEIFGSTSAVAVADEILPPARLSCHPNPFSEQLFIQVPEEVKGKGDLSIYNLKGQKVRSLSTKDLTAEGFTIEWDGKDENARRLGSGIYLLRLETDQAGSLTRKILKLN